MLEDVKIITEEFVFTGSDYKEFTSLFNMDETIIWEAELNTLILGDDLFRIYDKSGPSSKKCKRDINTCEYNFFVFTAWKKNITNFSSQITTTANKNLLNKPI